MTSLPMLASPSRGTEPDTVMRRLRRYLQLHRHATLGDLALHFRVSPDAMRGMLDVWVRKGRVRELEQQATCNTSCPTACDDTAMTIFEWVEPMSGGGELATFTALPTLPPSGSGGCCRQHP